MDLKGFATSKLFWIKFAWGMLIGFLAAMGVLFYTYVMNLGLKFLWSDLPGVELFSGSWSVVVNMTSVGFLVGHLHRFTKAKGIGVGEIIKDGRVDNRFVPGALLISLLSLIGGFSLGPVLPTGMLAGGLATWISDKRKLSEEIRRSNVVSSITAAYGGLFTAPLGAFLIPLEMPHVQTIETYGTLIIGAATAVVGFLVFFISGGYQFDGLLRLLDLPQYTLLPWHLVIALLIGLLGAAVAWVLGLTIGILKKMVKPLNRRPILCSTLAGLILGLLGMRLPLTLFAGSDGLVYVVENAVQIGAVLLVVSIFAKILATAGALSTGFIGGTIFPMFFVGGTLGTVIILLFPDIPIALAVGCGMVAVTSGILPIPISFGIYTMLIVGLPITEAIPIFVAGMTALFVMGGFALYAKAPPPEKSSGDTDAFH
jgi:H+/Cl- antiporter ClcA